MNAIWTAVKVAAGVLGWIVLLTTGLLLAGALAVVLSDWFRRVAFRRREREAQAATQQARDRRLLADLQARTWTDGELAALRQERGHKKRGSLCRGTRCANVRRKPAATRRTRGPSRSSASGAAPVTVRRPTCGIPTSA